MTTNVQDNLMPLPVIQDEPFLESPDYVRISAASAMALRLRSGRFSRDFKFGGINVLLNYKSGCLSDCGYCGLARTRPGDYEDKSFIRVEWPLFETDEIVDRIARYQEKMTRLCISMVTHGSAYKDTADITERITKKVSTPLSLLVAPPTLNFQKLQHLKDLGADMIGVGLDAITEDLFFERRTNVPNGGLKWKNYWDVINYSREIYGPWKVNIHTVVGLGESDKDLIEMFYRLKEREILAYLFCFNPEPDSRMGDYPKSTVKRWRRIQLVKHLIEKHHIDQRTIDYDDLGNIVSLNVSGKGIDSALSSLDNGIPFMTDGCPGTDGEVGCTRPYGSYKPTEEFRDYPFLPNGMDIRQIRKELALEEIVG